MKSFCESITATGSSPWCVRILTDNGLFFGGGVDTESLCGRVRVGSGWDLNVKFDPDRPNICHVCKGFLDDTEIIRTYVVEYDHAISYAGQDFSEARLIVRGSNKISVWESGRWLGNMNFDGAWVFKTKHLDTAGS